MDQAQWTAVDSYFAELFLGKDEAFDRVLLESNQAGLPAIQVSANQGKFLHLLALIRGARNILEIGTLGGYSTLWLARALPAGGRLVTLEAEPKHAAVARATLGKAGFGEVVEVRVGRASDTLPLLAAEGREPFDFIFLDADKTGYPDYFRWAVKLARKGTVIVADNVVRKGGVADASSSDAMVRGVREMNEIIAGEPRVSATALQTVGCKGYDGFLIAVVTADI